MAFMDQPGEASDGFLQALAEVVKACEAASDEIRAVTDPHLAYEHATRLLEEMQGQRGKAAQVRAEQVARIWKAEELSLAQLAGRIGVSKARAEQFVREAGKAQEDQ